MKKVGFIFAALMIAALVMLVRVWPGQAAPTQNVITVTTTVDNMDAFDQQCSLREALHNANNNAQFSPVVNECAAGSDTLPDVIRLSSEATYSLTIAGAGLDEGDLDILANGLPLDLRIETDGTAAATIQMTVNGQRVMEIQGGTVELHNLVITGGALDGPGGGILNDGNLTLTDSILRNNTATAGGGLYNSGTAVINNSQIALNNGTFLGGGGIYSDGELTISNSMVRANQASSGGGIYQAAGTLVVQGSSINLNSVTGDGGGLLLVNDIVSAHLHDSTIQGNQANGHGGGVGFLSSNYDKFVMQGGQITNNTAGNSGGGFFGAGRLTGTRVNENDAANLGGGLYTLGTLFLEEMQVHNNTAVSGGGMGGGTVIGSKLHIFSNQASHYGGGSFVSYFMLQDSQITDNSAGIAGGGMYAQNDIFTSSAAQLERVLLTNNISADGGAIWTDRRLALGNVTISDNAALADGAGLHIAVTGIVTATNITLAMNTPGIDLYKMGQLTLQNSIISNPGQNNCLTSVNYPEINSLGNNLSDDDSCLGLNQPTDIIADALLAPLANNGGNTRTHALLPGSPAFDAGSATACAGPLVNGVDQRGVPRPLGAACDMGAHEQGSVLYLPVILRP